MKTQINKRRLFFDIETSPNVVLSWRTGYEIRIPHDNILEERAIICICWKWEGEEKVHSLTWDRHHCDKKMLKEFSLIINSSDEAIGHNSDRYDLKWLKTRCLYHRIPMYPSYVTLDTLKVARNQFLFNSNKLDYIAKFLGFGGKMETGGFDLWKAIVLDRCKSSLAKMVEYCVAPHHRLLTKDLKWVRADEIKKGDTVLGFDENGKHKKYKNSIVQSAKISEAELYEVKLQSGKLFTVTGNHKWLVAKTTDDRACGYEWKETLQLIPHKTFIPKLMDVWDEDMSKDAGWLSGMLDGEGCLSKNRLQVSVSQRPTKTGERLEYLIKKHVGDLGKKFTKPDSDCQTFWIKGNLSDKIKFLGTINPQRLISKIDFDKLGRLESRNGLDKVVSVKPVGVGKMVVISTSTNTFVCDGYPMHNCKRDVVLLERVYQELRTYAPHKFNYAVAYGGEKHDCPNCESDRIIISKTRTTASGIVKRQMQCKDCGTYFTISNRAYEEA